MESSRLEWIHYANIDFPVSSQAADTCFAHSIATVLIAALERNGMPKQEHSYYVEAILQKYGFNTQSIEKVAKDLCGRLGLRYSIVKNINWYLDAGIPLVVGIQIGNDSKARFEAYDGKIIIDTSFLRKEKVKDYHAVVAAGRRRPNHHSELKKLQRQVKGSSQDFYVMKNSYGKAWGDQGYFYLSSDVELDTALHIFGPNEKPFEPEVRTSENLLKKSGKVRYLPNPFKMQK